MERQGWTKSASASRSPQSEKRMSGSPQHNTFARALRIAGYSWPLYAGAGAAIVIGLTLACLTGVPSLLRWLGAAGALVAGWFACCSFVAFHWMFDRSELLNGHWLKRELEHAPTRWVQINVGLEETTLPLDEVYPEA